MAHVLLIGFMGSGKSTVGRMLAARLGLPFVDLDSVVERTAGRTVSEIFARDGEPAFRAAEKQALRALETEPASVVACGGGVVLDEENREELHKLGMVVYLTISAEEALRRTRRSAARPLLEGRGDDEVRALLESRMPLYEQVADIRVPTAGMAPSEVTEAVAAALEGRAA